MKMNFLGQGTFRVLAIGAIIAGAGMGAGSVCRAQSAPSDLSPDVQEVLTLSRQHMDDSVITNYIISSGKSYRLSADDIIYLNNQGVSQPVINTLLKTSPAVNSQPLTAPPPAVPPIASTPPEPAQPAPPPVDESSATPPGTVVSVPDSAAPGLAPAPISDQASPPPPTMSYYQSQLAPYGNWVNVPGQGLLLAARRPSGLAAVL